SAPPSERLRAALTAFADARPGLMLEDKGQSVALHYRAVPELEDEVRARVSELVAQFAPDHELQPGKMVVEIRPHGCDKGGAVRALGQPGRGLPAGALRRGLRDGGAAVGRREESACAGGRNGEFFPLRKQSTGRRISLSSNSEGRLALFRPGSH
ncbi:trehalose-phosphatase, partial [Hansschlegelia beijingensis]